LLAGLAGLAVLVVGCSETDRETSASPVERVGKPVVYAANYPLAYFATRIGAGLVDVTFPAPPGEDPAFWMPDADDIIAFQNADVILLNGAAYSKWTSYASLPTAKTVDTSRGFRDRYMTIGGARTHSHGPGGDHSHQGTAFTTWLDFEQAALHAQSVRDALVELLPDQSDALRANCDLLEGDLLSLDRALLEITARNPGVHLLASHPVYDYLSRRYGLHVVSVLWEPDQVPEEAEWRNLSRIHSDHPVRWMIWESDPLPESVARLEEMGIASVVFDPCANRPETGDFLATMESNVAALGSVYAWEAGDN